MARSINKAASSPSEPNASTPPRKRLGRERPDQTDAAGTDTIDPMIDRWLRDLVTIALAVQGREGTRAEQIIRRPTES